MVEVEISVLLKQCFRESDLAASNTCALKLRLGAGEKLALCECRLALHGFGCSHKAVQALSIY